MKDEAEYFNILRPEYPPDSSRSSHDHFHSFVPHPPSGGGYEFPIPNNEALFLTQTLDHQRHEQSWKTDYVVEGSTAAWTPPPLMVELSTRVNSVWKEGNAAKRSLFRSTGNKDLQYPFSTPSMREEFPSRRVMDGDNHGPVQKLSSPSIQAAASLQPEQRRRSAVSIQMEERLSIQLDGSSSWTEPACRVIGRIHVIPSSSFNSILEPFHLILRDHKGHIEQLDARTKVCREDLEAQSSLNERDRIFRVHATSESALRPQGAPILAYTCTPKLKPIPLLLKTKLQPDDAGYKVGIRIRANPCNSTSLNKIVVAVVVPPDMDGSNIVQTSSCKGGIWDDMKRIFTWTLDQLPPGNRMNIQAFFPYLKGAACGNVLPRFPVLLQCHGEDLFSKLEILANTMDEPARSLELDVTRQNTVLFRKT